MCDEARDGITQDNILSPPSSILSGAEKIIHTHYQQILGQQKD